LRVFEVDNEEEEEEEEDEEVVEEGASFHGLIIPVN